jgi:hypothetical protein
MAKFPMPRTRAQFDFHVSPAHEDLIRENHGGGFLDQQRHLVVVRGTGTGKTHIADAIGSGGEVTQLRTEAAAPGLRSSSRTASGFSTRSSNRPGRSAWPTRTR